MNKDTGEIRALRVVADSTADHLEVPIADNEVELTAEEAAALSPLSPMQRLAAFFGRGVDTGKARKGSRPAKGTAPRVPQAVARTLAAGDHHKARGRKTTKAQRRATQPHVKRHARSRAHRGHGKA